MSQQTYGAIHRGHLRGPGWGSAGRQEIVLRVPEVHDTDVQGTTLMPTIVRSASNPAHELIGLSEPYVTFITQANLPQVQPILAKVVIILVKSPGTCKCAAGP